MFWKTALVFAAFLLSPCIVNSQRFAGDSCRISSTGRSGTCKSIHQCPSAVQDFENKGIRPTRCGFSGATPIVCCQDGEPAPTPAPQLPRPQTGASSSDRRSVSERKCEEYSAPVTNIVAAIALVPNASPVPFKTEKCEFGSTELIVGGHEAKVGEYPHMAAIGWDTPRGLEYKFLCGGTLISENYVLTAAHCTFIRSGEVAGNRPTVVRLGEHNINSASDGANPIDVKIAQMTNHPDYKPPNKYNDIALFRLERSVRINTRIRPACLWPTSFIEDKKVVATGWGLTEDLGSSSDTLQSVGLNIIDERTCSGMFRQSTKLNRGIVSEQLCAGDLAGGKDTCQGDSGGPLQISSKSNRCVFYVIGVTSFGAGCGAENTAGVYTRVSSYVRWIEGIVWPNE